MRRTRHGGHPLAALGRFIPAHAGNTSRRPTGTRNATVHPRACGEHPARRRAAFQAVGSSPRMRGTLTDEIGTVSVDRFIPAHAGNTTTPSRTARSSSVHPRACGEHAAGDLAHRGGLGSSPRMRGTRSEGRAVRGRCRFIPAHAGNTPRGRSNGPIGAVHPRACGEHDTAELTTIDLAGSSPRVRGTRVAADQRHADDAFIPARAGNTAWSCHRRRRSAVHPRACGEHASRSAPMEDGFGSSPRVRGTRCGERRLEVELRFIPARAGNTRGSRGRHRRGAVHPRACGEHAGGMASEGSAPGSSQRVRGTRRDADSGAGPTRFIPARAGNTRTRQSYRSEPSVHPRACGEHHSVRSMRSPVCGSSPRVRGTQVSAVGADGQERFIPARAGNTARARSRRRAAPVHPRACGEHRIVELVPIGADGSSPRMRGTRHPTGMLLG